MSHIYEFDYTGSVEEVFIEPGEYLLEVWGAQGGDGPSDCTVSVAYLGGRGGYAVGTYLTKTPVSLTVIVGGQNGYNGGGAGYRQYTNGNIGGCGGGATDIRLGGTALANRIIVAGGGGGGFLGTSMSAKGGAGGGVTGSTGECATLGAGAGAGGSQTGGNALGNGGNPSAGAGGGGGYYGGHASSVSTSSGMAVPGAGGGSGYVSKEYLINTSMSNGSRAGNGFARITLKRHYTHSINLSSRTITLDKIDGFNGSINGIEIKIGETILYTVENPEDTNITYNIDDNDCSFGVNDITIVTRLILDDGSEEVNEDIVNYVRYGGSIPEDSDIVVVKNYLSAMNTQIKDLRNQLSNVLSDRGVDVSDKYRLTDLVSSTNELSGPKGIKTITGNESRIMIIMNDGELRSCGTADINTLFRSSSLRTIFISCSDYIDNVIHAETCDWFSIALKRDGTLWACGYNYYGQMGDASEVNKTYTTPIQILDSVKHATCNVGFTAAIKTDGTLWVSGNNANGQLGLGDNTDRTVFTQVTGLPDYEAVKVYSCDGSLYVLMEDGSIWSTGLNSSGQLGLGNTTNKNIFTQINHNIDGNVKEIYTGTNNIFAVTENGSLWACGNNGYSRLGIGNSNNQSTFTKVTTNVNNDVVHVSSSSTNTAIVRKDGSLWICGDNHQGQMGINSRRNDPYPTFTNPNSANIVNAKFVQCTYMQTLVILENGTTWYAGYNYNGCQGNGVSGNSYVLVPTFSTVIY